MSERERDSQGERKSRIGREQGEGEGEMEGEGSRGSVGMDKVLNSAVQKGQQ